MEVQGSSFGRERIVAFVFSGPAEGFNPVKIFYILIQAEVESNVGFLLHEEVHWIGGADFGRCMKRWNFEFFVLRKGEFAF